MRFGRTAVLAFAVCLAVASVASAHPMGAAQTRTAAITPAPAWTSAQLNTPAGQDWVTMGGSTTNERYSTLTQINTSNVAGLKQAWLTHLDGSGVAAKYSQEASSVEYNGVLYISTGNDDVFAIDAATGAHIWTYLSHTDPNNGTVCCGWDSRGVAIGDGRVYVAQLDGKIVALDQITGNVVWTAQNGRWQEGYTETMAPLYYNGMVYVGISGAEFGARGSETAYDAKTGQRVWRFYTVPSPGEVGGGTWFGDEWMNGGGSIWNTPTVDPVTNTLYFTTSNADPWSSRGPGDNLFTSSFVALNASTGQYVWHFQTVHHDIWDYDQPSPTVLFDVMINGTLRRAIAEPGKTGWVYILDRTNGTPLIGINETKVPQSKFQNTSPTQPIPVGDSFVGTQCATKAIFKKPAPNGKPFKIGCIFTPYDTTAFVATSPGALGGNNWPEASYNPGTQDLYVCSAQSQFAYQAIPSAKTQYVGGKGFIGLNFGASSVADAFNLGGTFTAMNMTTNKIAWQQKWKRACYGGSMTTAGGIVFVGTDDGSYKAVDAMTGTDLWTFSSSDSWDAPGITYTVGGKQYVVALAGGNSISPASKHGDSLYAFALP